MANQSAAVECIVSQADCETAKSSQRFAVLCVPVFCAVQWGRNERKETVTAYAIDR